MSRHVYTLKKPAAWHKERWREALPLGNGLTGALIPTMIARTNRRFLARSGSATTFLFLSMMIGQIVVAYGTGSIADRFGIGPAMLLSSVPLAAVFFAGLGGGLLRRT